MALAKDVDTGAGRRAIEGPRVGSRPTQVDRSQTLGVGSWSWDTLRLGWKHFELMDSSLSWVKHAYRVEKVASGCSYRVAPHPILNDSITTCMRGTSGGIPTSSSRP